MTIIQYLKSLPAVRERCSHVFDLAKQNKLQYFTYNEEKESDVAEFCISLLKRDYGTDLTKIQPHSRWRHLDVDTPRVEQLFQEWKDIDIKEKARRIVDLTFVSVLLDAGAGPAWKYTEPDSGKVYVRSEGIAVASVHMFKDGYFSSNKDNPYQVDSRGLSYLSILRVEQGMQADDDTNPIVGIIGRTRLLFDLAKSLKYSNHIYESMPGRPGNMIDYMESKLQEAKDGTKFLPFDILWDALIELFFLWPSETKIGRTTLGDVWPCPALEGASGDQKEEGDGLVPFHKLCQWLAYSLIEVLERILQWRIEGKEILTGLPEYRNGGLLMDLGVLVLKPDSLPINKSTGLPRVPATHPAIVEWRALTVIGLDRVAAVIRKELGLTESQLTLAQLLEGATWKGGREIAKIRRPATGGPPIEIESDATIF
ncbi:hypothetical protein APHAL10511_007206 [Amanita phalloides]|nr:hypothetical protein APHAL10511_007206 [Amanita phalloides]